MAVKIKYHAATGKTTLEGRAQRDSDDFLWNQTSSLWQVGDDSFAMTEKSSPYLGEYVSPSLAGMGDAGLVTITVHDTAQADKVVGVGEIYVLGGIGYADSSIALLTEISGDVASGLSPTIEITETTEVIEVSES